MCRPSPWADPGDPPLTRLALDRLGVSGTRSAGPPIALHLRAPFPYGREHYPSAPSNISKKHELKLLRLWRENFDQHALYDLCESHRWMVANAAQKYVGADRELIIEYGVFGLRFAAQQWQSSRYSGRLAGYDPAKARFSTYARYHAERFMVATAEAMKTTVDKRGYFWEPPLQDSKEEFEEWAETPIPPENERDDPEEEAPKRWIDELIEEDGPKLKVGQDYDFPPKTSPNKRIKQIRAVRAEFGIAQDPWWPEWPADPVFVISIPSPVCSTPFSEPYCKILPALCMVYWQERCKDNVSKINYLKDKRTEIENENRKEYYARFGPKLGTFDELAADGMTGWEGDGDDRPSAGIQSDNDPRAAVSLFGVDSGDERWEPALDRDLPQFDPLAHEGIPKKRRNAPATRQAPPYKEEAPVRLGGGVLGSGPHRRDFRRLCLRPLTLFATRHSGATAHDLARLFRSKDKSPKFAFVPLPRVSGIRCSVPLGWIGFSMPRVGSAACCWVTRCPNASTSQVRLRRTLLEDGLRYGRSWRSAQ